MGYKILQLGKYFFAKGGIETVTQSLVEALQKDRLTDVLCFSQDSKTKTTKIGKSNIWESETRFKITTAPVSFPFFYKFKQIRNHYSIILIHAPNPLAFLALWLFPVKAKVVVQWHGDILNKGLFYEVFRFLEKKILQRADLVLATTDLYIQHSNALKKVAYKAKAIPLGIDEQKLCSTPSIVKEIKDRYKNKKIVFSLGRFVHFKGFEYLINAAPYLRDEFVIVIGGSGPLEKVYQQMIRNNKWENKVFIIIDTGENNWGNYYEACDVFCLPSIEKSESFGLVLLEAMSFSKPAVASNIHGSGTPWVNADGITGYNVSPKNSREIASAISKIVDSNAYDVFCHNARKRFEENFVHTTMIKKMVDEFDALVKS